MSWLRSIFAGRSAPGNNPVAATKAPAPMLLQMSDHGNPASVNVVALRNGFLICRRSYNPNGPDKVDAVYAATAEDIGPMIVAELAMIRLTK